MKTFLRRPVSTTLAFIWLAFFLTHPATQLSATQQLDNRAIIARVTINNQQDLERFVTLGLDLLEMRKGDDLFIMTTPAQVEELRAKGWAVTPDQEQSDILNQQGVRTFSGGY